MSECSTVGKESQSSAYGYAQRAMRIAEAGGIHEALIQGILPRKLDLQVAEALVLGLLLQNVRRYVGVLGHGSTQIGEVLSAYEAAGLVRMYPVRSEIEASHAASALRWVTGEKAAVLTSIGPGALQALAASLVPASDGLGVWYLLPDETTEDEGPNMQQIPEYRQGSFLSLCQAMGEAYCLHTPHALSTALRRGCNRVDQPHRPGPFYLVLPMNTQATVLPRFNLDELPVDLPPALGEAHDGGAYAEAAAALLASKRVVVKVGGGARGTGQELLEFLDRADGVLVNTPLIPGLIPNDHPRNMLVGGSKGSICGNYAMEHADVLVAIGTRAVCQSDCSRTGYPEVQQVININTDLAAVMHYGKTIALMGDAGATLQRLNQELARRMPPVSDGPSAWLQKCHAKRAEWEKLKAERLKSPTLYDPAWGCEVLTQPAAITAVQQWAHAHAARVFLDSGDVQANGFQLNDDDTEGLTYTETGASYMGFAASALLATALTDKPFYGLALSGDGSFTMNPQILIDGVFHGVTGCIVLLDNRRMGAISGLQHDQFGSDYATHDDVEVDYVAWAQAVKGVTAFASGPSVESLKQALDQAYSHKGLSLIHVPVYYGDAPSGGMGVYGRWNVGPWSKATQTLRHDIGL